MRYERLRKIRSSLTLSRLRARSKRSPRTVWSAKRWSLSQRHLRMHEKRMVSLTPTWNHSSKTCSHTTQTSSLRNIKARTKARIHRSMTSSRSSTTTRCSCKAFTLSGTRILLGRKSSSTLRTTHRSTVNCTRSTTRLFVVTSRSSATTIFSSATSKLATSSTRYLRSLTSRPR